MAGQQSGGPSPASRTKRYVATLRQIGSPSPRPVAEEGQERHLSRASCSSATASTPSWTQDPPFLEIAPLAAYGMYDDKAPSAGVVAGIRHPAAETMIAGQRRDGLRGHLPGDGQGSTCARRRSPLGQPAALPLSCRLWRRDAAPTRTRSSRPRPLRPHLLQPGDDERGGHPAARRCPRVLDRRRRLRAGDER